MKNQYQHRVWEIVIALLGFLSVIVFNDIRHKIDVVSTTLVELNSKIAVIIERQDTDRRLVMEHETRLKELEKKPWKK